MDIEKYVGNLTSWCNRIEITDIQFMYFNASDLTTPKINSTFKKFEDYYIIDGVTNNYWYIYNETLVKYLVKLNPTDDVDIMHDTRAQNADILEPETGLTYDLNAGDYIDFGLIVLKSGDTVVKTHKTVYIDLGNFVFDRSITDTYNFVFKESYMNQSHLDLINSIYIPKDVYIINILCDVMCGQKHYDKLDGFISKKQIYEINSQIISDVIIKPLYKIRKDLMDVRIIHKDKTDHIIILIDFIEDIHNVLLAKWPITNPENILKTLSTLARF